MLKNHLSILGILLIVGVVAALSGCVSSNSGNKINPNYSIEYVNPPTITSGEDYFTIGGYIKNTGNFDYNNVQLSVMGLDENNNVIFQKTVVLTPLNSGKSAGYKVTWNTQKKVKSAKLDIISAK